MFGTKRTMLATLLLSLSIALATAGQINYQNDQHAYKFGYDIKDGHGNSQMRHEESDDWGNKKGSYGYTDAWGIYRIVDYVADKEGYRAWIRTNEPGTANENPASVKISSQHPPPGAYQAPIYESLRTKTYIQPAPMYSKVRVSAPVYSNAHVSAPVRYEEPGFKRYQPLEEVYETKPKAIVYAPKRPSALRRIRKNKRISKPIYVPSYARANLADYQYGAKIAKPSTVPVNVDIPLYKDK